MTPWTSPASYQPRTFVHPNVDAVIDEIRAIRREVGLDRAPDVFPGEPMSLRSKLILLGCVAVMGWCIGRQLFGGGA